MSPVLIFGNLKVLYTNINVKKLSCYIVWKRYFTALNFLGYLIELEAHRGRHSKYLNQLGGLHFLHILFEVYW